MFDKQWNARLKKTSIKSCESQSKKCWSQKNFHCDSNFIKCSIIWKHTHTQLNTINNLIFMNARKKIISHRLSQNLFRINLIAIFKKWFVYWKQCSKKRSTKTEKKKLTKRKKKKKHKRKRRKCCDDCDDCENDYCDNKRCSLNC